MSDMVNHPSHYISPDGLEAIDVIKSFTKGLEGYEAVATGNALKYILRWKHKNGVEDLEKAKWYIDSLIENDKNQKGHPDEDKNCTFEIRISCKGSYSTVKFPEPKKLKKGNKDE